MSVHEIEAVGTMPYESKESLVPLMYRLLTTHRAPRTLVLLPEYWGEFPLAGWDGEVVVRKYPLAVDPQEHGTFDRVVLHWVLDEVGRGCGRRESRAHERRLLDEARRLVKPGGWVVGIAANWLCLGERAGRPVFGRKASSCRSSLHGIGLRGVNVALALPSGDVPRTLVSAGSHAARHYFRQQLAFTAARKKLTNRFLRKLAVESGIGRYLQGSLVFAGRLP